MKNLVLKNLVLKKMYFVITLLSGLFISFSAISDNELAYAKQKENNANCNAGTSINSAGELKIKCFEETTALYDVDANMFMLKKVVGSEKQSQLVNLAMVQLDYEVKSLNIDLSPALKNALPEITFIEFNDNSQPQSQIKVEQINYTF